MLGSHRLLVCTGAPSQPSQPKASSLNRSESQLPWIHVDPGRWRIRRPQQSKVRYFYPLHLILSTSAGDYNVD